MRLLDCVVAGFLGLTLILPSGTGAEPRPPVRNPDYRWPLDVNPVLVSSFGEYRATHLHAGLDLSTGGRSGLKCYAVADGWVARMRMSPFGYGKALYVQLDVGPLIVYAHLSRFAGDIAERAWAEQLRRRGFTFDIYLQRDEIRVRRGDVIAWSGATGIGHPHLHFEVRDGDVARNPQTAGFAVRDRVRPTIRDVSILPLDPGSHVEGGFTPHVIPAKRATRDRQPVRVAGAVGFAVQAIDKAADGPYRQAPYFYEVLVDGRTLYSALHERFDYAHNHHSKLDYDQDRLVFNKRRSMQLFARRGNRLHGRAPARDGRGVLYAGRATPPSANGGHWFHVEPGEHEVEVRVQDVAGNERSVRFPILVDDRPQIERLLARQGASGWEAVCEARDDVELQSVFLSVLDVSPAARADDPEGEHGWVSLVAKRHGDRWTAPLPADLRPPFVVQALARDAAGLETLRTWGEPGDGTSEATGFDSLEVTSSWRHGRLQLRIESPDWLMRSPQVTVEDALGQRVALRDVRQVGSREFLVLQELARIPETPRRVIVQAQSAAGRWIQEVPLQAEVVRVGQQRRVSSLVDGWELDVEAGSFFDDIAVRMQEFDSDALPLGRELRSTGVAVAMESREAPTNRRVRVRYREPGAGDKKRGRANTGLFYVDRSGNLQFLSAERDDDGALVGRARYLTIFTVLEDTTPPRLQQFKNTTRPGGAPRLRFRVTDGGADLDDDGLSVTIDGTLAIPEWDPETTRVTVHPTQELTRGTHTLHVVAVDQVGNRSERSWEFEIP